MDSSDRSGLEKAAFAYLKSGWPIPAIRKHLVRSGLDPSRADDTVRRLEALQAVERSKRPPIVRPCSYCAAAIDPTGAQLGPDGMPICEACSARVEVLQADYRAAVSRAESAGAPAWALNQNPNAAMRHWSPPHASGTGQSALVQTKGIRRCANCNETSLAMTGTTLRLRGGLVNGLTSHFRCVQCGTTVDFADPVTFVLSVLGAVVLAPVAFSLGFSSLRESGPSAFAVGAVLFAFIAASIPVWETIKRIRFREE